MARNDELQARAQWCLHLAEQTFGADRLRWLAMADFWLRQIKTMTDEGDAVKLEIVNV
jgi:hypothetical protein